LEPSPSHGISIIIPYYRGKKFIECTLSSLESSLSKTTLDYEILILNDDAEEDITDLSRQFINLKVVVNDENLGNLGIAKNRNKGMALSKYDYLYFIDQDDWVEPEFFPTVEAQIKKGYDIIVFNFYNVGDLARVNYKGIFGFFFDHLIDAVFLLKYGNYFRTIGQAVFKKSAITNFIATKTFGSDDFFMFVDVFYRKKTLNMKYIATPLMNYRFHENNSGKVTDFIRSSEECFDIFTQDKNDLHPYRIYLANKGKMHRFIRKRLQKLLTHKKK